MSEIKFRGKRKDNGQFVYGYVWKNLGGTFIQSHEGNVYGGVHEVDEKTVGQYAGFHDDSDDQVEVFGGAVVQFEYECEGHTCEVKYEGSGFMFVSDSLPDGYLWASELIQFDGTYCWAEGVMVVGNIHDDRLLAPKEGAEQHLSTKTDDMQLIKEDIQTYMKQRQERLQANHPGREPSPLRAMFVDTDESLSMFPRVEEGADKHEPV